MIQWRIYYEGGAVFDDSMGSPSEAPASGVVSIKQRNDCEHHPLTWLKPEISHTIHDSSVLIELLEGADWFWYRPDKKRWFRGDLMGFLDQAMHCGANALKQGRYLTHEDWEQIIQVISDDELA